jgi:CubicO group peptidase (beta-lactamase class C family)
MFGIHSRALGLAASLVASTLLAAEPVPLPRVAPETVGLDPARLTEATALLRQFVAERRIAGAVGAVARGGKIAYLEGVGFQDLESRAPMTERSLFRIYSMTKAVTAVSAMILHEEGKFALNDPVSRYLPEFDTVRVLDEPGGASRRPSRSITVADLLLHTSGLNHRTSDLYRTAKVRSRSITLLQFVANIVQVPLMEDPGTRFRYSEGTSVVGRLIEIWSGRPLDVFMKERLFDPLGMADTGFWASREQRPRLTTVYAAATSGGLRPYQIEEVPFTEHPALLEGAVGLLSTVPDFLRFSQMLLNRGELQGVRILSAKTVELITVNGLSTSVQQARGGGMGWGLANVNVVVDPSALADRPNKGEYGWDGSAGTIFWVDPTTELITLLMTQSSPPNPDSLRQRFKGLVQQALTTGSAKPGASWHQLSQRPGEILNAHTVR